jgi:hypothetical protein
LTAQVERFMTYISVSTPTPAWNTPALTSGSDAMSNELSALGQHLDVCRQSSGPLFAFHRSAEVAHGFLASRFVTTLVMIAVVIGICSLVF